MPELPEVETIRRGLEPHILGHRVQSVVVRQRQLRWPVPRGLENKLRDDCISTITRRGKYLLMHFERGTLLVHLGMSGSLCVVANKVVADKHCHVDIFLANRRVLRFRDPRRFGAILWTKDDPYKLSLLTHLGPEPLSPDFTASYLHQQAKGRAVAVKIFIMNSQLVVGVGNIYANEALFQAGIHPNRAAGRIAYHRYQALARAIRSVLRKAIRKGGTTLKDFTQADGKPGYFQLSLKVYDQAGSPCPHCHRPIARRVIANRSSYYCPSCQT